MERSKLYIINTTTGLMFSVAIFCSLNYLAKDNMAVLNYVLRNSISLFLVSLLVHWLYSRVHVTKRAKRAFFLIFYAEV